MFRPFRRPALAAALALALVAPMGIAVEAAPPNAPPVEPAPLDPAYDALYAAIESGVDKQAVFDNIIGAAAREYAKIPEFAQIEAEQPGFIDAMLTAMKPTLSSHQERVQAEYRPQMLAVLARHLTPAEARDVASVYTSPVGRKLLATLSRNVVADSVVSGIGDAVAQGKDPYEQEITREQVESDLKATTRSALDEMSTDDFAQIARLTREKPAILKMSAAGKDMTRVRAAMENEPLSAADEAELEKAVIAVVKEYMTK